MNWIDRVEGRLCAEGVPLQTIAEEYGTPTFVYSRQSIVAAFREFAQASAGQNVFICYAMKANSNLAIVNLLLGEGAGLDIVSGGELQRALAAGGRGDQIVFSGVGKSRADMVLALDAGVRCFNVESASELLRLSEVATARGKVAPISLRVNPDVDAGTHPYISTGLRENKFGIAHDEALGIYQQAKKLPGLRITGIDCHIGSQITDVSPYLAALDKLLELVDSLADSGIELEHIDLGGGLGIRYRDECPPERAVLLGAIFNRIASHPQAHRLQVMFEFGRSIVGNGGLLLSRVEYLKRNGDKHFAIIDAAMNDLVRPAMYDAWHEVVPVTERAGEKTTYDLVGPVCESGDWIAHERSLCLQEGDLIAILSAGAYGMVMSSNYNTRPRAAEVIVDAGRAICVRERETISSLFAGERLLK